MFTPLPSTAPAQTDLFSASGYSEAEEIEIARMDAEGCPNCGHDDDEPDLPFDLPANI